MQPEADGPGILGRIVGVSRETKERLEAFVALLRKWQPAENLIAPSTLNQIWRRHVADSAQLLALLPDARVWLDLGSGAGFPGMVIACLIAGEEDAAVHLVESNQRKCAFLRRAKAETGAPAVVHQGRIEEILTAFDAPVGAVTARALAPLSKLLGLASPVMAKGAVGLFPKGREFEGEIGEASDSFGFDVRVHKSRIDDDGVILEIANLHRKGRTGGLRP